MSEQTSSEAHILERTTGTEASDVEMRRVSTRVALFDLGIARLPLKGYALTTVADIVAESAYTQDAFDLHFHSKETFFFELLRYRAALRQGWWKVAEDPDLPDLGVALTRAMTRMAELAPVFEPWIMLMAEFGQTVKGDPVRLRALRDIYAGWQTELAKFFEPLVVRGWTRSGRTAAEIGDEAFAYIHGLQLHDALFAVPVPDVVTGCVRLVGSAEQVRIAVGR